ncbi:hypothetical protein [Spiroplasma endosymbiont of Apeira syringaria]|uniref:hypothetical protein n=1 Tax=Spiroplasma endosymbiont of Apeira syringaria TaxID=3066307 RepID=UPI0030D4B6D6
MQDIAVQFEKHCWIHSVSLFPPQVHVGRSPITYYYFEDSTLINPNIENIICQSLPFVGSYVASNGLQAHNNYSWQTIHNDFLLLTNYKKLRSRNT